MKNFFRPFVICLIDLFLFFFKRDKKIVLCTGWNGLRFADNSRYIFLYLNTYRKNICLGQVVWLSNDSQICRELNEAGYTAYMKRSFMSIYYHLRAGYIFYDQFNNDLFVVLTRRSRMVNLWHGMPIKKFGVWSGLDWNLKSDYLFTCSDFGDKLIGKAFHTKPNHYIHGMYPRNYYLTEPISYLTKDERFYIDFIQKKKRENKKILFYLPTFRKHQLQFLGITDLEKINLFFDFLDDHGYFLMTKIHTGGYYSNNDTIADSVKERILSLPPQTDIYPFLKETDILVTDYSSVLFDFLYLDRDIICYDYDLSMYEHEDKGLLIDYQSLPADRVYSLDELKENLQEKVYKRDSHAEDRKRWLKKCFDNRTMDDTIQALLR